MKIIGLVGFKGSGKDAAAKILIEKHGYVKESFARPVKDAVAAIFNWDREMLEGETTESRAWREEVDDFWSRRLKIADFTPRLALQWMGTEAGRNIFGKKVWALSLERRLEKNVNYIITDTRFPNEMKMITDLGGTIVRIRRGPEPSWFDQAVAANSIDPNDPDPPIGCMAFRDAPHISEWAWCGSPHIRHTINNDFSLEELERQIGLLTLMY